MVVSQIDGEETRFLVQGESIEWYLVDLASYNSNGWCGCYHFQFRMQPRLERITAEEWKDGVRFRCKHLRAARDAYVDDMMRRIRTPGVNESGQMVKNTDYKIETETPT